MVDLRRRPRDPEEITRRRFARRQWLRRWLVWRVILAVVGVLALIVAGVWLVGFSPVLGVKGVDVEGAKLLSHDDVRAAARVPEGEPLVRLDIEGIENRVEELPAIKDADVSRAWPDRVLIQVQERTVVAVFAVGERYRGMDADGIVFRSFAQQPGKLPLLKADGELTAEVRTEGAMVAGSLPRRIARQVDHIELRTIDQIDLNLRDGRTVVWGSAEESEKKAAVLAVLLAEEEAQVYDVSVPGRPTTR